MVYIMCVSVNDKVCGMMQTLKTRETHETHETQGIVAHGFVIVLVALCANIYHVTVWNNRNIESVFHFGCLVVYHAILVQFYETTIMSEWFIATGICLLGSILFHYRSITSFVWENHTFIGYILHTIWKIWLQIFQYQQLHAVLSCIVITGGIHMIGFTPLTSFANLASSIWSKRLEMAKFNIVIKMVGGCVIALPTSRVYLILSTISTAREIFTNYKHRILGPECGYRTVIYFAFIRAVQCIPSTLTTLYHGYLVDKCVYILCAMFESEFNAVVALKTTPTFGDWWGTFFMHPSNFSIDPWVPLPYKEIQEWLYHAIVVEWVLLIYFALVQPRRRKV
jgi:hypothetical protein